MSKHLYWEPAKMVGWYDPRQLLRTGLQVASSSLFAENADGRLVQPLFDPDAERYDERYAHGKSEQAGDAPRTTITIDYIADTGDGFNSTYAVAYFATENVLSLKQDGNTVELPRGDVLVLGGDEVYPTASADCYAARFVQPFEMASAQFPPEGRTALYAIPGNHDWYDNLVAFTRLFINKQSIGRFRALQARSYFALQLPHGWWLFAPDVQLGSDIDYKQQEYFEQIVLGLPETARVILCTAEPHWVTENEELRSGTEWKKRSSLLRTLEQRIHGPTERIRAVIAGDLHHYRRHVGRIGDGKRDVQLITAGGGGAFLHPTHGWRDGSDPTRRRADARLRPGLPGYRFQTAYPTPGTSRELANKTALFPFLNGWFLTASAAFYGMVAIQVILEARLLCAHTSSSCAEAAKGVLGSPGVVTLAALIVAGFWAFTDTSSKAYRHIAGPLHGFVHAAGATLLPVLAVRIAGECIFGIHSACLRVFMVALMIVATTAVGAIFGAFVMGFYLFISLNVFGRHRNETFSALREERYKSFLRLRIDDRGRAHVYAIGIERPPTQWTPAFNPDKPRDGARRAPEGQHTKPALVDYVLLEGEGA